MKLGIISITMNAVSPISKYINKSDPKIEYVHYLDEGLINKVRSEKIVSNESIGRMESIINNAVKDGMDAILLTCTVFSKYTEYFEKKYNIPVIAADKAMIKTTIKKKKRTAIICTFEPTIKQTKLLIEKSAKDMGEEIDFNMILAKGAFDALKTGNKKRHDTCIIQTVKECAKDYELIVLAQMSMSHIREQIDNNIEILTSPACALEEVKKRLYKER